MEIHDLWVFLLAGVVTFVSVFIQIVVRTGSFQRVFHSKANWTDRVAIVLLFGTFSILGTYMGIPLPSGAIINVRDLGPMMAGLAGGPVIGLGAGLIGGIHRFFLGGFTCTACAVATVLVGLTSGIIRKLNKDKLIRLRWGLLFAALMECFHMGLVLLIARPFSEALETVKLVSFPMALSNAAGVAISILFISHYFEDNSK